MQLHCGLSASTPYANCASKNNFGVSINKARNLKFEILVGGDTPTKGKIFNEPKCA
jgi:hypothetical protein